jgi:hypothetical protein
MKLVPNMDQENYLLKRMARREGNPSDGAEYDEKAMGDQSQFFQWSGEDKRAMEKGNLNFPELSFDQDHIPLGDSVGMCLGLSWIPEKDS